MWSAVRQEEKLDIFRPNEMIQRKPEKKCLERHEIDLTGKEYKKCVTGTTQNNNDKMPKIDALFT